MHQSMLDYASRRYLKIALLLCGASVIAYLWHDPISPPNGGTWLGYTLGGIGAALILWLTALGIRKRAYGSSLGSLQGWVSAHVYLGLSLILIATLHAGFQVGWNIHTLAYVLMMLVIISGIVGVVAYLRFPEQLSANRAGLNAAQMLQEVDDLDQRAERLITNLPIEIGHAVRSAREHTRIGGGTLAILTSRDASQVELPAADGVIRLQANDSQNLLLDWLGTQLSRSTDGELSRRISDLINIVAARRVALRRLQRDARVRGWLEIWLYFHVPITFALLGALIAHVVSVFLYW
jgi:hypothetical protein